MDSAHADAAQRIVLIGGGHSQIEVLRQFVMGPMPRVALTLISRDYYAPYSGMLPGLIAGHYTFNEAHINVALLARAAGARFIHAAAERIELNDKLVFCPDRPPIPFDVLSINIGSRPEIDDVPGAVEYALPAKPVDRFLEGWAQILTDAIHADDSYRVVTVGGGAGGVELTLSMQHRIRRERESLGRDPDDVAFAIITASGELLPTHNARVRKRMTRAVDSRGIQVYANTRAERVDAGSVHTDSGDAIAYDALVWTTHASAQPWIAESGLDTDENGFLSVDETLRSTSHPFVFAAGDIANMVASPRPKSGVFAVRQGPYLGSNLRRALRGDPLESFTPQREFLSLISTGDANAIGSRGFGCVEGRWVWRWKDRIDRAFMDKYDATQMTMPGADMNGDMDEMRCGGCGCKLGADDLSLALSRITQTPGTGVVIGLEDPDDAAVVELPSGTLAVQSVDFFRPFISDSYVFAQIAAEHCLTDIYAMGGTAHTALAIATIPYDQSAFAHDVLGELLAGSVRVLNANGATLTGGHTTEGPELMFGLSVQGYVRPDAMLRKGGMQADDVIIMTKPIGTGVVFAAEMRGMARSEDVESAIASMLLSNRRASEIFLETGATACSDITGFGLVAHLAEMSEASKRDIVLDLDDVPLLDGVADLSRAGVRSTLFPANVQHARKVQKPADEHEVYPVLFDPQTAGGLAASVPSTQAETCLAALHDAGYAHAAIIGRVSDGSEGLIVLST